MYGRDDFVRVRVNEKWRWRFCGYLLASKLIVRVYISPGWIIVIEISFRTNEMYIREFR